MNYIDKELLVKWLKNDGNYKELLSDIEKGLYDAKDYQQMCRSFIGKRITNFFCNGFFGSDHYDLEGATILNVYLADEITVEIMKENNEREYAYFDNHWRDWKTVYRYLSEWTEGEQK